MPDFAFYKGSYCGRAIQESAFPALAGKAGAYFRRFSRSYRQNSDEHSQKMAICAMAEVIYAVENFPHSAVTVGKVSYRRAEEKTSLERRLYQAASRYVEFYRGVSR